MEGGSQLRRGRQCARGGDAERLGGQTGVVRAHRGFVLCFFLLRLTVTVAFLFVVGSRLSFRGGFGLWGSGKKIDREPGAKFPVSLRSSHTELQMGVCEYILT